jgi:hypothetical protein
MYKVSVNPIIQSKTRLISHAQNSHSWQYILQYKHCTVWHNLGASLSVGTASTSWILWWAKWHWFILIHFRSLRLAPSMMYNHLCSPLRVETWTTNPQLSKPLLVLGASWFLTWRSVEFKNKEVYLDWKLPIARDVGLFLIEKGEIWFSLEKRIEIVT